MTLHCVRVAASNVCGLSRRLRKKEKIEKKTVYYQLPQVVNVGAPEVPEARRVSHHAPDGLYARRVGVEAAVADFTGPVFY